MNTDETQIATGGFRFRVSSVFHLWLLIGLSSITAHGQWGWPGYQARLVLDVEEQTIPTVSLAVCFGGQIRPDGKDVRVVSVTGALVKSQLMQCTPLSISRIAFQPIPGLKRYYVYFNCPKETNAQADGWEPTTGLTLETRQSPGKQYYADA